MIKKQPDEVKVYHVAYHGTSKQFNKFRDLDKGEIEKAIAASPNLDWRAEKIAHHFSDDPDFARWYGKRVVPVWIDTDDFKSYDFRGYNWINDNGAKLNSIVEKAKAQGYKGLIAKNIIDRGKGPKDPLIKSNHYITWTHATVRSTISGNDMYEELEEQQKELAHTPQTPVPMSAVDARLRGMAASLGISSAQLTNPIFHNYLLNMQVGGYHQPSASSPVIGAPGSPNPAPIQPPTSAPQPPKMMEEVMRILERNSQHPFTDAQINKGLGSALKNYDNSEQGVRQSLVDLMPKLPDNAAVKKTAPAATPTAPATSNKTTVPVPKTGPSITDTGMSNKVKVSNPKTGGDGGQSASAPAPTPEAPKVDYARQEFQKNVDAMKADQKNTDTQKTPDAPKPSAPAPQSKPDDSYSGIVHKSLDNIRGLGIPIPHFEGGGKNKKIKEDNDDRLDNIAKIANLPLKYNAKGGRESKNIEDVREKGRWNTSQGGTQYQPPGDMDVYHPDPSEKISGMKGTQSGSAAKEGGKGKPKNEAVVDKNPDQKTGPRVKGSEPGTKCSNPVPTRDLTDAVIRVLEGCGKKRAEGGVEVIAPKSTQRTPPPTSGGSYTPPPGQRMGTAGDASKFDGPQGKPQTDYKPPPGQRMGTAGDASKFEGGKKLKEACGKKRTEGGAPGGATQGDAGGGDGGGEMQAMAKQMMGGMGGGKGGGGGSPPQQEPIQGMKPQVQGGPGQPPGVGPSKSPLAMEGGKNGKKKLKEDTMMDAVVSILSEKRDLYGTFR